MTDEEFKEWIYVHFKQEVWMSSPEVAIAARVPIGYENGALKALYYEGRIAHRYVHSASCLEALQWRIKPAPFAPTGFEEFKEAYENRLKSEGEPH